MGSPATVVLFTDSYPYDAAFEGTFMAPEIPVLRSNFGRVVLVPQRMEGGKDALPEGVEVEEGLARSRRSWGLRWGGLAAAFRLFGEERRAWDPRWGWRALKSFILHASNAELARRWTLRFLAKEGLDAGRCVFYTYWFGSSSTGIGWAKSSRPGLRLVSRAHAADLYEDLQRPPYFPCRPATLRSVDMLFPDSREGAAHVGRRYPWFQRCEVARLGVRDPGFLCPPSTDGVFRAVSCSFLIPRKRIDLLIRGLGRLAASRPGQAIEWSHIGGGPLRAGLEKLAAEELPPKARFRFLGQLPPDRMMAFYRDNPIDAFVNVSSREGTPMSLMEAASCGIPLVASAVGGNAEIVSDRNGIGLGADPLPEEIASAFARLIADPRAAEKREGSRRVWQELYDAGKNFQAFADRLGALFPAEGPSRMGR